MARKGFKLETPLEKERREFESINFSEKLEEDLKKELFKEVKVDKTDYTLSPFETKFVHHPRPDEEWDVPITETIEYFDPELSYELTGYRPITMEKGLDFNPDLFRDRANIYNTTGNYTDFPPGCKPYVDFWTEEFRRCQEGYTVGKYRITGDHYFFLNYYRMNVIQENAISGQGRNESFPGFLSKQYEFFHYVEMCEKLGRDVCLLKARGLGASEMLAALAVRPYTTNKGYQVMITCANDAKLAPLREKCWKQLDWLNMNTNGGMRHARLVVNNNDTKRASLKTTDGIEYGWGAQITSIVADSANKIRGSRIDRLIYDEAGSNSVLTDSWIKGDALVALGGKHFGVRFAVGTGGDDMALEGLATMFSTPEAYNILPFKNYDTETGTPELSSFFIPAHKFALVSDYLDNRGVTNHVEFRKYYEKQRSKLTDNDLINECAEHCFTPKEALSKHGDNIFDAAIIADRMVQIRTKVNYEKPKRVALLWTPDKKIKAVDSESSNIQIVEPPLLDDNGEVYKNLYVAGIDSIDIGSGDSATERGTSEFCIVIKKRIFGQAAPQYVAMYKERPRDIRTAYEICIKLLTWYNCKAMLEHTRVSIITYLRDHGRAGLLMERPKFAAGNTKNRKNLIGIQGGEAYIKHGLELIGHFLADYYFTINYMEMLDQLLNYTYEMKTHFDIIAAMEMAEIGDEDMTGVSPKAESINKQWRDIGYYIDERGYKRKGVIPNGARYTRLN